MQNEVFPTEFVKKKNDIYGSNKITEKAFTGMKTYKDDELQPWMRSKVGDTIQTENVAKYHFDNTNHRTQFNQSVRFPCFMLFIAVVQSQGDAEART
jgi:hypothetical protein